MERGLDVTFTERRAEDWHVNADRILCIGLSYMLGGSRGMLVWLVQIVPCGWMWCDVIFGDNVLPVADLATVCREKSWEVWAHQDGRGANTERHIEECWALHIWC